MANLRVDKITSTETFETTGSVQFDGNSDYLSIPTSDDFAFGTGDFTIEFFVYLNQTETTQHFYDGRDDSNDDRNLIRMGSSSIRYYADGADKIIGSTLLVSSLWYHVAVSRSSGVSKLFVNGVSEGSFSDSINYLKPTNTLFIGVNDSENNRFADGYLSNFRVIKGKALYTSNFKPPMRELEVVPGTVLLACQSKTDATLEKTGKTITVTGTAVASELTPGILTPVPKAGAGSAITGSVEFNGNDYLEVDLSNDAIGTDEFTIEMWVNPGETSFTATNRRLIRIGPNNNANNLQILYSVGNSNFEVDNGTNELINPGITTVATQSWSHIALTRQGTNNLKLFVNGVEDTATTTSADISQTTVQIGDDSTLSNLGLFGFISNLRIVKGTALYTDDFIPPTRELKKVPGTVLLCCQDPDNPLTEATGKTITGYGSLNQSYGINLVTNGSFDTDSDWTKGTQWTIVGGAASITDSPDRGSDSLLTQDASSWIQAGQTYRVAVDWSFSAGDFDVRLGGDSNFTEFSIESSHGSPYFFNIEAGATNTNLAIIANQHAVGDINSIHVDYAPPSKAGSNFTPQVGDDRKVTFEGVTKINSNAYFYLPTGDTVTRDSRSGRGVLGGGQNPGNVGTIDFVTIQSMGNSLDFGDLNQTGQQGGCSSSTRGLFANGSNSNTIDFITIPTTGNALDFGDRTVSLNGVGALSSSTRGVFLGGGSPSPQSDVMDYVTIASTGDAIDFGNLTTANKNPAGCSSPVRGVIALGGSPGEVNTIDFITIASTGNSLDFGDCTEAGEGRSAFSSSIRGIFTGSYSSPTVIDVIQYVTISSKGNTTDFGNLVLARTEGAGTSDSIRGLSFGGFTPGSPITPQNIIDYVTITTTGNAKDFGDLTQARQYPGACSDSHGGLG